MKVWRKACRGLRRMVLFFWCLQIGVLTAAAENGGNGTADPGPQLKLFAQSAVLMDGDTGRVLYAKDGDTARPMASTTKIMTCILALEYGDPDDPVMVSSYAAGQPKVHLGAPAGRTFRLEDLLYSLMLESHNDTAVMIAEHLGGSVGGFAEMMNRKAAELGCTDTWFVTPNGLDGTSRTADGTDRPHSTTARDLARIMNYCVWESPESEAFLKITRTQNYFFTDLEGKGSYSCVNHNALLTMVNGVISGKTGFTGGAGYCYVGAMEKDGRRYSLALLGCGWPPHKTYKWSDARTLLEYGLSQYEKKEVYREICLPRLWVRDGIPENGDLSSRAETGLSLQISDEEKTLQVLLGEGEEVTVELELPESLQAPVREGTEAGRIVYRLGDRTLRTYPVYVKESVRKLTWRWCLERILTFFVP